jgi:hypothetical protein
MALAMMTKLDAINSMLERVWESPVSSLDTPGVSSVAAAKRILDNTIRSVLSRGWTFNVEHDVTLARDADNKIPVPANAIEVDSYGDDKDTDVVVREGFLYNRTDHTFVFTKNLKVTIKYLFDFEQIPQTARAYIALMAARTFKDYWEHAESPSSISMEEKEAMRNLEQSEAQVGDYNILDSWDVSSIMQRW